MLDVLRTQFRLFYLDYPQINEVEKSDPIVHTCTAQTEVQARDYIMPHLKCFSKMVDETELFIFLLLLLLLGVRRRRRRKADIETREDPKVCE